MDVQNLSPGEVDFLEASSKLASHFVVVRVSLTEMPQRIIGKRGDEVPYADDKELIAAFKKVDQPGGFTLTHLEFAKGAERFRGRMRSKIGRLSPDTGDGNDKLYLVAQVLVPQLKKELDVTLDDFENWKASSPLQLWHDEIAAEFATLYDRFKTHFGEKRANDYKARVMSRIASVEDMKRAKIRLRFDPVPIGVADLDSLGDPELKNEIVRARNKLAMELTKKIPSQIRSVLLDTVTNLTKLDNPREIPLQMVRGVKNICQFARDNNFLGDSLIVKAADLLKELLVPVTGNPGLIEQDRNRLEEIRRALAKQQSLYSKRLSLSPGETPKTENVEKAEISQSLAKKSTKGELGSARIAKKRELSSKKGGKKAGTSKKPINSNQLSMF